MTEIEGVSKESTDARDDAMNYILRIRMLSVLDARLQFAQAIES